MQSPPVRTYDRRIAGRPDSAKHDAEQDAAREQAERAEQADGLPAAWWFRGAPATDALIYQLFERNDPGKNKQRGNLESVTFLHCLVLPYSQQVSIRHCSNIERPAGLIEKRDGGVVTRLA